MKELMEFLDELEKRKIYYRLNKVSENILVEIAVPGQRWEVEFCRDGEIQIEKFISNGIIYEHTELTNLFQSFSD